MLRYTLLRTLIFLGSLLLLWLLGLRDRNEMMALVIGAAVLSMIVSWFALRRFRDEYSAQIAERLQRRSAQKCPHSDEAVEDAEIGADEGEAETYR